uniref:UPF0033 domain-containing protein n=1 Tax=Desulfobacca acetoxidans TaxID=60893 RepID=A0A7V4LDM6_9BACT
MSELVDARGLSCPQPVLITLEKLRSLDQGELVVLVDTDTSRENVLRAAASLGWQPKAVETQEAMGEKGELIAEMGTVFEDIAAKMGTVNASARSITSDAADIRSMNDQVLAVNRAIDEVILENISMAGEISFSMSQVVSVMGDVGGLLGSITDAASQQLGKIREMHRLAQENNAAVPSLP